MMKRLAAFVARLAMIVKRFNPDQNQSTARIRQELRDLWLHHKRPSHWPLKVYAPLLMSDQRVEWKSLTDSMTPGRPKFGQRWVHPQELMETTGRWPAYYAARLDKHQAKYIGKRKVPNPLDSFSGGFA